MNMPIHTVIHMEILIMDYTYTLYTGTCKHASIHPTIHPSFLHLSIHLWVHGVPTSMHIGCRDFHGSMFSIGVGVFMKMQK